MAGIKKMFSGGPAMPAPPPLPAPTEPEQPEYKRLTLPTDPDVLAAAQRTRQAALARKGRLSTILTDQTRGVGGYGSDKLG